MKSLVDTRWVCKWYSKFPYNDAIGLGFYQKPTIKPELKTNNETQQNIWNDSYYTSHLHQLYAMHVWGKNDALCIRKKKKRWLTVWCKEL